MFKQVLIALLLLSACSSSPFVLKSSSYESFDGPVLAQFLFENFRPNNVSEHFAIIIGANAEERHRGNISLAYQVLIEHGYERQHIVILDVSTGGSIFPKTASTSRAAVGVLMSHLQYMLGPEDTLLVYITGHGKKSDTSSQIVLNNSETMSVNILLDALARMHVKNGLLFEDECYMGHAAQMSACNWVSITVSTDNSTSYGVQFPREFWNAFRHGNITLQDAFNTALSLDSGTLKQENFPVINFGQCINKSTGLLLP